MIIATRLPFGIGLFENTFAVEKRFFNEYSRITPDCLRRAFAALSAPAREPVCDEAALAPAAERPAFNATIGFFLYGLQVCGSFQGFGLIPYTTIFVEHHHRFPNIPMLFQRSHRLGYQLI